MWISGDLRDLRISVTIPGDVFYPKIPFGGAAGALKTMTDFSTASERSHCFNENRARRSDSSDRQTISLHQVGGPWDILQPNSLDGESVWSFLIQVSFDAFCDFMQMNVFKILTFQNFSKFCAMSDTPTHINLQCPDT